MKDASEFCLSPSVNEFFLLSRRLILAFEHFSFKQIQNRFLAGILSLPSSMTVLFRDKTRELKLAILGHFSCRITDGILWLINSEVWLMVSRYVELFFWTTGNIMRVVGGNAVQIGGQRTELPFLLAAWSRRMWISCMAVNCSRKGSWLIYFFLCWKYFFPFTVLCPLATWKKRKICFFFFCQQDNYFVQIQSDKAYD